LLPIDSEYARLPVSPTLSLAWIVKLDTPFPLGVPVIAPVLPLSPSPAGSEPEVIV
jgi:hypothetical protein